MSTVIQDKIYALLQGHNLNVTMYDEEGKKQLKPGSSTRFFVEKPNMMIHLADTEINVSRSKTVPLDTVKPLHDQLERLAHERGLQINTRLYSRNAVLPKDFVGDLTAVKESKNLVESNKLIGKVYGKKKTSYQKVGENTLLIYRHVAEVNDNARSRTSKITEIDIKSHGETYRMSAPHVKAARALGVYMEHGGKWLDGVGSNLQEAAEKVRQLGKYRTAIRKKDPVGAGFADMATKNIDKALNDFLHVKDDDTIADILDQLGESICAGSFATVASGVNDNAPYAKMVSPLIKRYKTPENLVKVLEAYAKRRTTSLLPEGYIFESDGDAFGFIVEAMTESKDLVYLSAAKHIKEMHEEFNEEICSNLVNVMHNNNNTPPE